jgi:hypothetical protein
LSIKSGKTVGSGKVVLLIFLTVLISRQKAIPVFGLNGLAVKVFNLLILECPLTLERLEISRKPSFPLFPQSWGGGWGARGVEIGLYAISELSPPKVGLISGVVIGRNLFKGKSPQECTKQGLKVIQSNLQKAMEEVSFKVNGLIRG